MVTMQVRRNRAMIQQSMLEKARKGEERNVVTLSTEQLRACLKAAADNKDLCELLNDMGITKKAIADYLKLREQQREQQPGIDIARPSTKLTDLLMTREDTCTTKESAGADFPNCQWRTVDNLPTPNQPQAIQDRPSALLRRTQRFAVREKFRKQAEEAGQEPLTAAARRFESRKPPKTRNGRRVTARQQPYPRMRASSSAGQEIHDLPAIAEEGEICDSGFDADGEEDYPPRPAGVARAASGGSSFTTEVKNLRACFERMLSMAPSVGETSHEESAPAYMFELSMDMDIQDKEHGQK